jgi:hypothetical protein
MIFRNYCFFDHEPGQTGESDSNNSEGILCKSCQIPVDRIPAFGSDRSQTDSTVSCWLLSDFFGFRGYPDWNPTRGPFDLGIDLNV